MRTAATVLAVTMAMAAGAAAHQANKRIGAFAILSETEPVTDAVRKMIIVTGDEKPEPHGLGWLCMEDGLNVLFMWSRPLSGNDGAVSVDYRFQGQTVVSKRWELTDAKKGAFLPMADVKDFTAAAQTAPSVVLRVLDKHGDTVTETFQLNGLTESLKTLPCAK